MKRTLVLGGGRVGGFVAVDLAADPDLEVTVADRDAIVLESLARAADLRIVGTDLADPGAVRELAAGYDLVVGALPGHLGFAALQAVIEAGRDVVDISFFPEDARDLEARARAAGVTAVVDFGVAPGLCGVLTGLETARMDRVDRLTIQVGGLPMVRTWPFEYRAVFSPADVIEEYTRPARIKRHGRIQIVPALSGCESVDFPEVGTLESFLTDGLRTLLDLDIPDMEERTLRYPGHAERMRMLRETGFFSTEPVEVGGVTVRPLDLTSHLLFPRWQLEPGEGEFTVLRVEVEGEVRGRRLRRTHDLLDHTDPETGHTSMARTTGLPCAMMARLVARGAFDRTGIVTPESVGRDTELAGTLLRELAGRDIVLDVAEESL